MEFIRLKNWTSFGESGYAGGVGNCGSSDGGNGGERDEAFTGRAAVVEGFYEFL
jgi:hypothetical protein